ncbi:tRNA lysidine(34) synthetase TilS [Candidatus Gracilibacteria bacterium]|nr:tRNA lysidine(34) synthetase TilS [Candidatus Gracilibacteria bacterium]
MKLDLEKFLEKYNSGDEKIILGCSTGADSMFLLYQLLDTKFRDNIIVAFFNHNTRVQCAEEERFIVELGKKEGFTVEVADCDFDKIMKLYPSKGFEELAREKRYQFFDALMHIHSAKYVMTAHHLDDRIETMMFNMIRGTKLTGLINMTLESGIMLRPLIGVKKGDIYEYLQENNLKYFEDESNNSNDYSRNYIRNEVIPSFKHIHPEYQKNISQLLNYFEVLKEYIDSEVLEFLGKYDTKFFSIKNFLGLSPLLQKEIIRYIYFITNNKSTIGLTESNINEVIRFMNGKNNKTKKEIQGMKLFKDGDNILY